MRGKNKKQVLADCQKAIGHRFRDPALLDLALTHRSYIHETPGMTGPDNERLEFLGDSVLGFVTAELAYHNSPKSNEGDLTEMRSQVVSRKALARKAADLDLGPYMRLGRGQVRGGKMPETILSCAIEAVLGAVYLDGGLQAATRFITRHIWPQRPRRRSQPQGGTENYKEELQKFFLKTYKELPVYQLISQSGPAHKKLFNMAVAHKGQIIAKGEGPNKKGASQEAARLALQKLNRPLRRSSLVARRSQAENFPG